MGPTRPVEPSSPQVPLESAYHPHGQSNKSAWIWAALLVVAALVAWRVVEARRAKSQAAPRATARNFRNIPVPVGVATVRSGDLPIVLSGLGTVTAFNTVNVHSRVDGQLEAVDFQEGQLVRKGQLLAQIDPRPFQVQLEQAQGQKARDAAQLRDAQTILARDQALFDAKVLAKQQVDTQAAAVGQLQGSLAADQAAIDAARLNLTYTHVVAPLSGRVGLRQVDPGNVIHANDQNGLVVITQVQPIAVLFTLPEDQLQPVYRKLRAGAKLPVDVYDRDNTTKIASGTLLTMDNVIDPTTGTSRLKAVFTNANSLLFPNQFVNVHLLLDVRHNQTLLPVAAVQTGPQGSYVYVVQKGAAGARRGNGGAAGQGGANEAGNAAGNGRGPLPGNGSGNGSGHGSGHGQRNAQGSRPGNAPAGPAMSVAVRPITLGATAGDVVAVAAGLAPGDVVVVDGMDRLQNGSHVIPREAAAGAEPGATGNQNGGPATGPGLPSGRTPATAGAWPGRGAQHGGQRQAAGSQR